MIFNIIPVKMLDGKLSIAIRNAVSPAAELCAAVNIKFSKAAEDKMHHDINNIFVNLIGVFNVNVHVLARGRRGAAATAVAAGTP